VLEASGTIARNIGNTYRQVFWTGAGGFAAFGGDLTVTLNGGQTVDWGNNPQGFNGKTLILGSATATDKVTMTNNIALKATRTVQVNDNTSTANDIAEFSGVLSDGGPVSGLTKTGTGLLILSNANAYTGVTTVSAGALVLNSANALPGGIGATGGTSNLTFNGGVIGLGVGDFTRSLDAATNAAAATFTGNGGWAAYGADRLVNLGGASAQIVWATANTGLNAKTLILGAATATNKVTLQNPLDLGNAARTVQVDDGAAAEDAELSGALSGAGGGLTKTGAGTLVLSNANTHTGATTVSAGTLKLSNPSALQNSTLTMGGGSLVFDRSVTANAFTFGGLAATAAGAGYDIALQNNDSSPAAVALTVGGNNAATTYAAVLSGTDGSLTKVGTGTLTLTGANTYTGATSASGGQITVSGASGVINQSSGITLAGGRLLLDNATNSNDRIKDAATITLSSGGELNLTGSATGTTETVGNLALAAGNSTVTVKEATAGQIATLAGAGFSRSAGATALFRGQSLGQNATQMGMVTLTDTTGLTLVGTTTLSGAASGDTTKNVTIVPYLIGGSTDTDTGSTFVTYDTALGFRALNVTNQFVTLAAAYATQTDHENVKSFNGTITAADPTVNSLLFNGAHALNGSGTLTVDSGAIALVTNNAASIATGFTGGVTLGNGAWNEGVITVTQNVLTINPAITVTGGGGLIKAGGGTLVLAGANTYTGPTTINGGTLTISNAATFTNTSQIVLGAASRLDVNVANQSVARVATGGGVPAGTFLRYSQAQTTGGTGPGTILGTVELNITNVNPNYTLDFGTGGKLTNVVTATYNSPITVSGDASIDSSSAVFTGGTAMTVSASTAGAKTLTLTGTNTGANTIGGVISDGSGTVGISKTGAGTWILTAANTYTGATVVTAGILRADNNVGLPGTSSTGGGSNLNLNGGVLETGANLQRAGGAGQGQMQIPGGTSGFSAYGAAVQVAFGTIASPDALVWGTAPFQPGTFILNAATANNTIDFKNPIDLNTGTGAVTRTVQVNANVATMSGSLTQSGTGAAALTKTGAGTLTLSGANTYTGTTTVSAGTLAYGANAVISTGAVTVNGTGAVLAMGTYSDTVGLVTLTAGDITGSGTLTSTSGFTMNNAAAASVSVALDGAVGLTKSAAGVLTLSGTNTYTGGTTVTAGALTAAKAASLPGYDSAAKVVFNGGTVGGMVGGSGWTTGQVDTLLTNATKTSGALGIDTTNGSLTQWTAFTTTNLGSALGLTKLGANTLILDQANTYAGTTTVSAGVLNIRNGAGLGSTAGGTTVASGAALELQGGITIGAEVLSLNGTGISNGGALRNVSGDNTCGGLITLAGASRINSDSGTLTLDVASGNAVTATNLALTLGGAGNITVADPIATGTGTLIKDGTGTAILAGNNTYTGLTTVSAGTLTLSGNNTGTGGTTLTAGTLNVNHAHALGNSGTITLTSGTINNTSGATITNSVANPITLNGNFTFGGANDLNLGTGAVTNAASRTITLNGTGSALTLGGVMTNGMAGDQTTTVNGPGNTLVLGGYALSNSGTSRTGTFNGTGNVTITGAVVNGSTATASALTYSGSGVLTLSGTNTYAGATTVSSGRLNVAGSINASAVTVSNAGTVLAGGGSVKSLAMNAGTIVAPGDGGVGDLGVVAGNCSLATTAVYQWELGSGGNDVVDVAGNLTLTDGWVLKLIDAGGTVSAGTQYNLFTYTGTLSLGTYTIDNSLVDWNISGATISSDATRVYITGLAESGGMAAPAIPEPATAMLLIFGAAAMLRRRRIADAA
jgi:autotransporter-associated beta strand protein